MTTTILVTGASSGIGRDTALALAASGFHVIAAARRLAALEALRDAAPAGAITPLRLDLDDPASIAAAAAAIERLTGGRGVDAIVNNAGYATAGALIDLSDADLRAQFETNVFGLMALTRALVPAMIARGRGRIVNVSSVSGRIPAPVLGAYHASKYALEALSDALRMELAPLGIQVVIVEPGTIRTEFAARTLAEAVRARHPGSRYAAVYERASAIEARFGALAGGTAPVVAAIRKALTRRRPSARYVAPRTFLLAIALVRLVPTCWYDAVMRRVFGLTRAQLGPGAS
ncbi:MAG TPA: SDR family oxidoreductase [Kofleriaceae bacterium]|nr:SDR family oxidoreductase [Kofleriaceae bacterium]